MQARINHEQLNQWANPEDAASVKALNQVLTQFIGKIPAALIEMKTHLGDRDFTAIAKIAHTLKGTSGNLGLALLHELCFELEKQAKKSDPVSVEQCITEVETEVPQTLNEVLHKK